MSAIHFFRITTLVLTSIKFAFVFGQAPSIEWQRCYGDSANSYATSIIQTNNGDYVFVGSNNTIGNNGASDVWIVKIKSDGTIDWEKSIGGSDVEGANSVAQTFDQGLIVSANTSSTDSDVTGNHGSMDFWIVKLDSLGTIQWQECLGSTHSDYVSSVIQTIDSGFAAVGIAEDNSGNVTGNHGSWDYWLVKLKKDGAIQWENSYGGSEDDEASSVIQTPDSGFVIAGYSASNDGDVNGNKGYLDCWLVKVDSLGIIQWQKCLGGSSGDMAIAIKNTDDGGFAVAGSTGSNDSDVVGNHGTSDVWFMKLDHFGNLQWQKCLGGSNDDFAMSFDLAPNHGYVIAAGTTSSDGDVTGYHNYYVGYHDYWIVRIDSIGNLLWQKCLGGSLDDIPYSVISTNDNGSIIVGYSYSNDGDLTNNFGGDDAWVVKLSDETGMPQPNQEEYSILFPNPATSFIYFNSSVEPSTIIIHDCAGRIVQEIFMSTSDRSIDISNLPSGIYFLEVSDSAKNRIGKFVKQ